MLIFMFCSFPSEQEEQELTCRPGHKEAEDHLAVLFISGQEAELSSISYTILMLHVFDDCGKKL